MAGPAQVSDIVDRVFHDWLIPPEEQPVTVTFSSDVTKTDTTWGYDPSTLAPDEEELLSPGVIVEAGTEQARITAADYNADEVTVIRGVNGTEADDHDSGDDIVVAPKWSRQTVLEAVKDNIVELYPDLWHISTEEITTSATYTEVPADVVTINDFIWQDGDHYHKTGQVRLLDPFPPSSTGKAVQFQGIPNDHTLWVTYRGKFTRPLRGSVRLSTLGVEEHWGRIVAVGAAAQVVGQSPQNRLSVEYITEQLEYEGLPATASIDIRNGLLTLHRAFIRDAARSLDADEGVAVVYNSIWKTT